MVRFFRFVGVILVLFINLGCSKNENPETPKNPSESLKIRGADISFYPSINKRNIKFYNTSGNQDDFLTILKKSGINTIRLKLWVHPKDQNASLDEVEQFSNQLKAMGFKIWLTLHYSDTWADPGKQITPEKWQNISFAALKDSVSDYTTKVMNIIDPEYIQIGNEINSGMLHPQGNISTQPDSFLELLKVGSQAVRNSNSSTKIILHFAGHQNADWFFNLVNQTDYDIIGLSYYPLWHGKDLNALRSTMKNLVEKYDKEIVLAETAYPFTLDWNDWTNNIVGTESQLLLPDFPPTPEGQQAFIKEMNEIILNTPNGLGICYWGAELIAFDGNESKNGSPWENQSLFDFSNKALPVLENFRSN